MNKSQTFSAKVHFVAGKGGVGKTQISLALASFFSKKNKTLLVELSEEETGELHPKQAVIREINKNLGFVRIYPDQALYEYLCLKVPTKKMIDTLLSQNLFRLLCSAMPGLSDLIRLGKIWFHADNKYGSKAEIYERIVVDMPSTGFIERFLSIASVVNEAVKVGPLAREASHIHEYFRNKNNACLHLVTLPLELVVNETAELCQAIANSKSINLGALFINKVLKLPNNHTQYLPMDLSNNYPHIAKIVFSLIARLKEENRQQQRLKDLGIFLENIVIADRMGEIEKVKIVEFMVQTLSSEISI